MSWPSLEDKWALEPKAVGDLARRIAAVPLGRVAMGSLRDPSRRLAFSLGGHARSLGLEPPESCVVLSPGDGRARVRERPLPWAGPWRTALEQRVLQPVTAALKASGRAADHHLLYLASDSLNLRPTVLPMDPARLWNWIEGPATDPLPRAAVRAVADAVLWQLGLAMAWALVGDLLPGDNPMSHLITLLEEDLVLLDLTPHQATLWLVSDP